MAIKKISFISLFTLILFFGFYLQSRANTTIPKVVDHSYENSDQTQRWRIKVNYPELLMGSKVNAKAFNTKAKSVVMAEVKQFEKTFLDEKSADPDGAFYDLSISYTVEFLNLNLVSIIFANSAYSGGAHGISSTFTLNYDLKNNHFLSLEELFTSKSNFLNIISTQSIAQILKKQGASQVKEWVEEGAGAHIKNFTSWNITPEGLQFTFDTYQVASYAEGDFTTYIPYSLLSSAMKTSYRSLITP